MPNFDSLLDLLGNEGNENPEIPEVFQSSPYYDFDGFIEVSKSKKKVFSLITLNCQSLNAKFTELNLFLQEIINSSCHIDALCLQETWLSDNSDTSLFDIDGYTLISKGKASSRHGGVAIYLSDNFCFKILPFESRSNIWDGLFIEIHETVDHVIGNKKKLIIGNIYRPPRNRVDNYQTFIEEINEIMSDLQRQRQEVIIVGDFNLDLLKIRSNVHIKDYFDMVIANGFIPKITLPTRLSHNHGTLIDNILVKLSVDFSTSTSGILWNHISDHQPCFAFLDYLHKKRSHTKYVKIYPHSPTAISNLRDEISVSCAISNFHVDLMCNPNINCDLFENNIISAINTHLPVKKVRYHKHKHRNSKWITKGILISIKFRDRLYADLQMTDMNDESYLQKKVNLSTYNRILKQNIRLAKKQYYHSCFEKFKDDIKKTWASINELMNRTKKKNDFPKQFLINGRFITHPLTIANEFNNFFTNIGKNISDSISQPQNISFEDYLSTPFTPCFKFTLVDTDTVAKVIDQMKPKSSCGFDGLSNKLLKMIKNEIIDCITLIINQSFSTNTFPDKLKLAKVIPLHKKNENYLFDNYRPISLLPSFSKVIERIMHTQILHHFTTSKLMYDSQYGFRPNHSTELAALEVIDHIACQMDNNDIPLTLFLDLSKAFDCLNHDILLSKLKYYGFQENPFLLMKSYFYGRSQYVSFDDTNSEHMSVNIGVPQGSILGPLLFLIYMNDITSATSLFHPVIYADDTTLGACISYFGSDISDIETNINNELENIKTWLNVNKLSLNVSKTKAMIFHSNRKNVIPPRIFIDNHEVQYVEFFNYLGIILDKHLSWNEHINMLHKKASKMSGILCRLKNFLPKATLLTLYNSLVLSHFNYGILLWGAKTSQLEKLQKKLIRIINCARYNAHTNPLFKNMFLLKLSDIRLSHELIFCYKFQNGILPAFFYNSKFKRLSSVHGHNTRGSNKFQMPKIKHSFMKDTLRYRIPFTYNSMEDLVISKISTHTLFGFKRYVKKYLINLYSASCEIINCFICQRT